MISAYNLYTYTEENYLINRDKSNTHYNYGIL